MKNYHEFETLYKHMEGGDYPSACYKISRHA